MDANTEVLQAAGQATYNRDLNGALQIATGLNLDANGICKRLWGKEFNEAFDEMLGVLSNHALLLPGVSGAYASAPDSAALSVRSSRTSAPRRTSSASARRTKALASTASGTSGRPMTPPPGWVSWRRKSARCVPTLW